MKEPGEPVKEVAREAARVAEGTLATKEENNKEKNSKAEQSESGSADLVGRADPRETRAVIKRARGKHKNVLLSDVEYRDICNRIFNADAYIDQFSEKLHDKGYRFADHYKALLEWWERDRALPRYSAPRGLASTVAERELPRERTADDEHWDEFFEAAVARSLGEG